MKIWSFTVGGGWSEIDDFLHVRDGLSCDEERALAGFYRNPSISVGNPHSDDTFQVRVFTRYAGEQEPKAPEYAYIMVIDLGSEIQTVAVKSLPDLLELLRQTVPLASAIDHWSMARSRFEEKVGRGL